MKYLKIIILFSFSLSFIFSSCSRKLSINKRHYSRGYTIHLSKKPIQANTLANTDVKQYKTKAQTSVISEVVEETPSPYIIQQIQNVVINQNAKSIQTSKHHTGKETKYHPFLNAPKLFGHQNNLNAAKSHSDEGHSLLWIVVVVLIVLWALGIISGSFGLGILINLLLVIAFVLLILWLLRII